MSSEDSARQVQAETWRLQEIVKHIDLANQIIDGRDLDALQTDDRAVLALERCVHIVTEAVIQIGEARMRYIAPDQPWRAIRSMGNKLRHEYWGVDLAVLYDTVHADFPSLYCACAQALATDRGQD